MSDLERYELFGWDYERLNPLGPREVAWHVGHAQETGGPILELACGSGRLLCWLAEAGYEITGIDLCGAMLGIARDHVAKLPEGARSRASLMTADMGDFDLGRTFPLIVLADNSLRHLAERDRQLACLRCVRRHLADGGRFLLTERRLNPEQFRDGTRRFGWSEPMTAPDGARVRRRGEMSLEENGRWVNGFFLYEITSPDGLTLTKRCDVHAPVMRIDDYLSLLAEAGLAAEVWADYERRTPDDSSHLLCFVCRAL